MKTMKHLLLKELRLALHPTALIFLGLSAMLLIPSYPYLVVFFYTGLAVFFTCLNGRENKDVTYTLLLPVSKADVVRARFLVVMLLEAAQEKSGSRWNFLRGRCLLGQGDFAAAAKCLHRAEDDMAAQCEPLLEQCYRQLGDFKMAYEYACKQRGDL